MKPSTLLFLLTPLALSGCATHSPSKSGTTLDELAAQTSAKPLKARMVQLNFRFTKGGDVLSAPKIVTRPGQAAKIEIIREFQYPTEFDLPALNAKTGIVTPTTPVTFETRSLGISIDCTAKVKGSHIILLGTATEQVFEGFNRNPGAVFQPIHGKDGKLITENQAQAPMFTTRETPFFAALTPGRTERLTFNSAEKNSALEITGDVVK